MNEVVKRTNEVLLKNVVEKLKLRNMEGFYAKDKEEALSIAKELLKGCKTVSHGGTVTITEMGLLEELQSGKYDYNDRSKCTTPEQIRESYLKAFDADAYIGSVNAMTYDGILVNIDGNSNRVAAYSFGPKKVILIVGVQKLAKDLDSAIVRARNVAAPANCVRQKKESPCTKTGSCTNCLAETICCQFLITRFSAHKDRIKVILVNDVLGF